MIDLGCGGGADTRAFLEHGWSVFAVDAEPRAIEVLRAHVPEHQTARLTTAVGRFNEVDLPAADLVFASLSLPFAGDEFEESIAAAIGALKPGGWFVAVLLGGNDSWADEVATVDSGQLEHLLLDFDHVGIKEQEFEGDSGAGPKHWHWVMVTARRILR